jgi:anti-sigma factor RsiW
MSSSAHPADAELRALVDEELAANRRRDVEGHLAECLTCGGRLSELEATMRETSALLDVLPAPRRPPRTVLAKSRARRGRFGWVPIAAALALAIVTVAGATVGRSSVRSLITQIRSVLRRGQEPPPPQVGPTGISFVPTGTAVIAFDERQETGVVQVSVADGVELMIQSTSPVHFRVHSGGVTVLNRGSAASYTVVVPQRLSQVRISVAGQVLFTKSGSQVEAPGSAGPLSPEQGQRRYTLGLR